MADMIVEYRVMPEDGEIEFSKLEEATRGVVQNYDESVQVLETNEHDVGFGLKAVKIKFQLDENKGSEQLEEQIKALPEVGDVIVELMDRL